MNSSPALEMKPAGWLWISDSLLTLGRRQGQTTFDILPRKLQRFILAVARSHCWFKGTNVYIQADICLCTYVQYGHVFVYVYTHLHSVNWRKKMQMWFVYNIISINNNAQCLCYTQWLQCPWLEAKHAHIDTVCVFEWHTVM